MRTKNPDTDLARIPRLDSYAAAYAHATRCKPWRGSEDIPLNSRKQRYMFLRLAEDGVQMWMKNTHVITWGKDDSITVLAHPGYHNQNCRPMERVLPEHLRPEWSYRTGGYIMLTDGQPIEWWDRIEDEEATAKHGHPVYHWSRQPRTELAYAYPCRFVRDANNGWKVAETNRWRLWEFDKAKGRELSKAYNLPDFAKWLRARKALGDETMPGPQGKTDLKMALSRLVVEDFAGAFDYLPTAREWVQTPSGWQMISTNAKANSIDLLRRHLYSMNQDKVCSEKLVVTMTRDELMRTVGRVRNLGLPQKMTEK